MKNSILIASLFVVALAACSKKEETVAPAAEPSTQSVIIEQAPAAAPAPVEPAPVEPAPAAEPAPADATVAPATEEKK